MSLTFMLHLRGLYGGHVNPVLVLASEHHAAVKALQAERDEARTKAARLQLQITEMNLIAVELSAKHDAQEMEIRALRAERDASRVMAPDRAEELAASRTREHELAESLRKVKAAFNLANEQNDTLNQQVKALQSHPNSYQSGYNDGRRMGTKHAHAERQSLAHAWNEARRNAESLEQFLRKADDQCKAQQSQIERSLTLLKESLIVPVGRTSLVRQAIGLLCGVTSSAGLYTSVRDGDQYQLLGTSIGAGTSRGQTLVVYLDLKNGQLYHRTSMDFSSRMMPVSDDDTQEQAA